MDYPPITIVHLILTHRCNLGCKYCFVHQEPKDMTWKVAQDSIDFLARNSKESGNRPQICFFGGEPLLMWDSIIVKSCEYIGENYKDYGFHLTITTNGTLLTDDKMQYMKAHKIGLLTSIDGGACTQNYNRPFLGGHGSFDIVEKNLKNALQYGITPTFRSTMIPPTCHNAYEDYLYAISLGYKSLFSITNSFETWDDEHEKILEEQYQKIADHYIKSWRENKKQPIELSLLNQLMVQRYKDMTLEKYGIEPFRKRTGTGYKCGLGQGISAAISPTGGIYGCQELTSNEDESSIFYIGNIYTGVINERREALTNLAKETTVSAVSDDCETCDAKTFCNGGCTANNYLITGCLNKVPHGCCFFYQLLYRIAKYVINELKDVPEFIKYLKVKVNPTDGKECKDCPNYSECKKQTGKDANITMTLIEAINAKNALKNYFDKVVSDVTTCNTVSGVTTCKIIKFIKFAEGQEKYANDVKTQLLAKYGERDAAGQFVTAEGGKGYKIRQDSAYQFLTASLELQNTEVEYSPALTLEELSPLGIKMGDMYAIFPIIKDA